MIVVTIAGKGGYTSVVKNISGVTPPPPWEHHEAIESLNTIAQGMQTPSYELEGQAPVNTVLASSNSEVMAQLAQMNVAMNDMQSQLETFS